MQVTLVVESAVWFYRYPWRLKIYLCLFTFLKSISLIWILKLVNKPVVVPLEDQRSYTSSERNNQTNLLFKALNISYNKLIWVLRSIFSKVYRFGLPNAVFNYPPLSDKLFLPRGWLQCCLVRNLIVFAWCRFLYSSFLFSSLDGTVLNKMIESIMFIFNLKFKVLLKSHFPLSNYREWKKQPC